MSARSDGSRRNEGRINKREERRHGNDRRHQDERRNRDEKRDERVQRKVEEQSMMNFCVLLQLHTYNEDSLRRDSDVVSGSHRAREARLGMAVARRLHQSVILARA